MEKYNRFQLILLYYIQIDSVLLRNVQIRFIIIRESNTDMYVPNRNPCELSKRKPCRWAPSDQISSPKPIQKVTWKQSRNKIGISSL